MEYAENVNYWKTGRSSADTWIDKAKREIASIGGTIQGDMMINEENGRSGFMIVFSIGDDKYRLMWPVLESKSGSVKAARVQAATALYHDVKAKCVAAKFHGARTAFFAHLQLPDGRVASTVATPELPDALPLMLTDSAI